MLVIFFFRKLFIKAVTFKDYVIAIQKEFVWHCPSDMHIFIAKIRMSERQYDTFHLEIYVKKNLRLHLRLRFLKC